MKLHKVLKKNIFYQEIIYQYVCRVTSQNDSKNICYNLKSGFSPIRTKRFYMSFVMYPNTVMHPDSD